jgi:hypothetical protein
MCIIYTGKMDPKKLPVVHMCQDDNGDFMGVALVTAEGFRKFLADNDIDAVALRVVPEDPEFKCQCRMLLNPMETPYITRDYKDFFLKFKTG